MSVRVTLISKKILPQRGLLNLKHMDAISIPTYIVEWLLFYTRTFTERNLGPEFKKKIVSIEGRLLFQKILSTIF